jgi:hypothetical protein
MNEMKKIHYIIAILVIASPACNQPLSGSLSSDLGIAWEKELTVPVGTKSLEYKVYYGGKIEGVLFPKDNIRDIQHPSKKIRVHGNDTHIIMVKYSDQEPIYFPVGSVSVIEVFPQGDEDSTSSVLCSFDKSLMLSGVFLGSEDGGGVLHYDNGWKWYQCSD